jgi:hypothetical protein
MEILLTPYTGFTAVALILILAALLVAQLITNAERRLVAATAILLAGVFFTARSGTPPAIVAAGALCWLTGLAMLVREALAWRPDSGSRVGPLAAIFLLPPTLFGAVLAVGAVLSALLAPARLALRLIGA